MYQCYSSCTLRNWSTKWTKGELTLNTQNILYRSTQCWYAAKQQIPWQHLSIFIFNTYTEHNFLKWYQTFQILFSKLWKLLLIKKRNKGAIKEMCVCYCDKYKAEPDWIKCVPVLVTECICLKCPWPKLAFPWSFFSPIILLFFFVLAGDFVLYHFVSYKLFLPLSFQSLLVSSVTVGVWTSCSGIPHIQMSWSLPQLTRPSEFGMPGVCMYMCVCLCRCVCMCVARWSSLS